MKLAGQKDSSNPQEESLYNEREQEKSTTVTAEQLDSGLIFARALALMNYRDIRVEHILRYELAPVPTSMFDEKMWKLRIVKSKSIL